MDYNRLKLNLEKYGRDTTFAYVSDSFKRELRQDKKFKQWKRLLDKATLKAMSPEDRKVLNSLLAVTMEVKRARLGHTRRAEDMGNNELVEVLYQIEDISEFLGKVEDVFDSARFLGMLEELINLYLDGADVTPRVNEFEKL